MSTRGNGSPTGGAAVAGTGSAAIRNVVLVGPSGSGKTTLSEHLLHAHGVISRAGGVIDGTTVSDSDELEHRQGRSISMAVLPYELLARPGSSAQTAQAGAGVNGKVKVNLIDVPGFADYVGELRAGLRAADCALFVVAATEPIDAATRALWQECEHLGMPRAVVISKLDHPRADYDAVLLAAQEAFGGQVVPLYLPLPALAPSGLAGLLGQQVTDYGREAGTPRAPRPDEQTLIDDARGAVIEAIIEESEDESLLDRYLAGEPLDVDPLIVDLETAVARASFFPVVPVAATTGLGLAELDEIIVRGFPSAAERALPTVFTVAGKTVDDVRCDPAGPLLGEVVKTTADPYLGRVSLVRVFSGVLSPDLAVHVSGHSSAFRSTQLAHADHDEQERVGSLASPLGSQLRPVDRAVAGDLVAIAKLSHAETSDTISSPDRPLLMQPWSMPEPLLPVAVQAVARADEDKLSQALHRLAAEDPTVRIEHNTETRQLVLWTVGEAHSDVLIDRLAHRMGVEVERVPVEVVMRETFGVVADGHGRHVKQSGGHGQYAVCDITVEPLTRGAGFEFVDRVVGGAVPRQFIASVEKGVRAQMERGTRTGHPVVDIKVTLRDGKSHSVDSSDMAFQAAGGLALKDAADHGGIRLLEPIDDVEILVVDEAVGAVMGDLAARRAHVLGSETIAGGRTLIRAEAPQTELLTYATQLRSLSHGNGSFSASFARYDLAPTR